MGTHQYGRSYRILISDGALTPVFSPIGGEGSSSKKVSTDSVDFASKDDGKIKAQGWGQQSVTFSVQGKTVLPDVGLEKAYDVSNAAVPEIEIQVKDLVRNKIVWQGFVGVGNFSMDFPSNGAVTYSFDMSAIAAPSVDDMTPA